MSQRPSRPRRSAATSYAHLLQPLALTSESESGASGSDSDSTKRAKRLKKHKTAFIPSEDSASEFEESPEGPRAEDEEEDDDADDGAVSEDGVDDLESGQGDDDLSDVASTGGDGGRSGARARPGAEKPKRARPSRASSNPWQHGYGTGAKTLKRSLVITKGDVPVTSNPGQSSSEPTRATPSRTIASGLDSQYASFVPHYLPPRVSLVQSDPAYSTARVETSKAHRRGQTDDDASALLDNWTSNPFAPEKTLVRDVGWAKGKWRDCAEEIGVGRKWGGWYKEIPVDSRCYREASEADVESRLPLQCFTGRPIPFRNLTVSDSKSGDANTETEQPDLSNTDAAPQTQTQSADPSAPSDGRRQVFAGGVKGEGEKEITLGRFEAIPLNSLTPRKPGHLLNVGGPVSALAWLPRVTGPCYKEYLAVSTISSPSLTLSHPANLTGSRSSSLVQIWSLSSPDPESSLAVETAPGREGPEQGREEMKFELGLLLGENEGEARDLQWCPRGGSGTRTSGETAGASDIDGGGDPQEDTEEMLGILAGVFTDGKVKVFVVPKPDTARQHRQKSEREPIYLHATRLLELSMPNASCLAFAWGSWETIAAGCSNGYVAVWYIGDALRNGSPTARPIHHVSAHECAIRSIVFVNTPPPSISRDAQGTWDLDGEPQRFATVGYDGTTQVTDLRECDGAGSAILLHERSSSYAVAWSPQSGCVYADDQDDRVRAYLLKSIDLGNSKRIGAHRGTVWSLATSDHHPFVLSASADGTVMMHSGVRALRRRRIRGHFSQTLYALEFDRESGKWHMKDNFQVEHRTALDSLAIGSSTSSRATGEPALTSIVAWPAEVQVNKVCWHPNLERSALVASGGNWGCVRIDWVEGVGQRDG